MDNRIGLQQSTPAGTVSVTLEEALRNFVDNNYRMVSASVFAEQSGRCLGCGRISRLEVDHIQMRSHGRLDTRANLRGLCHDCHVVRHSKAEWVPEFRIEDFNNPHFNAD